MMDGWAGWPVRTGAPHVGSYVICGERNRTMGFLTLLFSLAGARNRSAETLRRGGSEARGWDGRVS
jgi:hypothetical protein